MGRKERCKKIDGGDEFEDQLDTGEEPKRFIVTCQWVLMNMLSLMKKKLTISFLTKIVEASSMLKKGNKNEVSVI